MKSMIRFVEGREHKIYLSIVVIISFLIIFLPFIQYNQLNERDLTGHVYSSWFIKEYLFPNYTGWNPFHFLGFPQGLLYPFLLHYIVAILAFIFPVKIAFKLVVVIAGLLIPVSIWFFSKSLVKGKYSQMFLLSMLYSVILLVPGYLGFGVNSLFSVGLATSFVSIPLLFFYVAEILSDKKNITKAVLLLSAIILTHIVSSLVAICISLGLIALRWGNKKQVSVLGKVLLITFFLTAFFTIPFVYFRSYTLSPKTDPISPLYFFLIAAISILPLLIFVIKRDWIKFGLFISITIISISFGFSTQLSLFESLQYIHPYRFVPYLIITVLVTIAVCLKDLIKTTKQLRKMNGTLFLLFISLLIPVILVVTRTYDVKGRERVNLNLDHLTGTITPNYRTADILDQTREPYYEPLYTNEDIRFISGQFEESSYNAPFLWSLAKGYIPTEDEKTTDIEDIRFNENDLENANQYIGVNYSINTGEFTCPGNDRPVTEEILHTSCLINNVIDQNCEKVLYSCSVSDGDIFTLWTKQLVYTSNTGWLEQTVQWWKDAKFSEYTLVNSSDPFTIPKEEVPITIISRSRTWDTFRIRINSNQDVPVLVRMSYFPKWKAYKDGQEIPIYRVAPNLMMVYGKGEVEFKYENTLVEYVAAGISIITSLTIILFPYFNKRRENA